MSQKQNKPRQQPPWMKKFLMKYQGKVSFIIGGFVFITLYLGGLLSQLSSPKSIMGEKLGLSIFLPHKCLFALFTVGFHGLICVLLIYAALGLWLYTRWIDKHRFNTEDDDRGFKIDNSGTFGTSSLMRPESIKDIFCEVEPLDRTNGIILGKFSKAGARGEDLIVSIPLDGKHYKYNSLGQLALTTNSSGQRVPIREKLATNGNRHMMIIGVPGSGKSYCFSRPAIFQAIKSGESVIVTDPKGELYSDTSVYAEEHGYTVKIFNLAYPQGSDSWDALGEIDGSQLNIEAQNFANIIISNTSNPGAKGDEVYSNGEKNLLTALILYVLTSDSFKATGKPKTLGSVYELLTYSDEMLESLLGGPTDADGNPLGDPEANKPFKGPWKLYSTASPNMKGNLKLGLGVRLQTLQDEVIKNITGTKDIDLIQPGKSKCLYYVIISDMNDTFKFISSLFFTCLFSKLVEYSRQQPSGQLPVPVNVIMDEFIAIGKLPDFDKKLATVRSARINIYMIFQTLAQLQQNYPDGLWETLIGCCYTFMCLSCGNDMGTAEYLSKRTGTMTTALENLRVDKPMIDIGNVPSSVSHSYSAGERQVLQPVEVIKLAGQQQKNLVMIAGSDVFAVEKFGYPELVNVDELKTVNMYEHCPAWTIKDQYSERKSTGSEVEGVSDGSQGYKPKYAPQQPEPSDEVIQEDTQPDEPDVDDLADVAEVPKGKRRIEQPKSNASKSSQNLTRDF